MMISIVVNLEGNEIRERETYLFTVRSEDPTSQR